MPQRVADLANRVEDAVNTTIPPIKTHLSIIVPVADRADDLTTIFDEFANEIETRGRSFEFIFVLDGGFGRAPAELVRRSQNDRRLKILSFAHGFGETAALQAGIESCVGETVVTLPAYFQVQPPSLHSAIDLVEAGRADLVTTCRYPRNDSWMNRLQSRGFHALVYMASGQKYRDIACGVRVARREVFSRLRLYGDLHRFIPALASREGFRVSEIDAPQHPNDSGRRLYSPGVYLRRLLDILAFFFLTKFTEKPLRFFGLFGLSFVAAGTGINVILLVQRLGGQVIANRPMLLLAVLLIALGVQAIGLGLVGEIIVHLRAPERRSYRVRELAGQGRDLSVRG